MENNENKATQPEEQMVQNHEDDGFGDGSPRVRPWVLVLTVFALLAGVTAAAVMNATESLNAQQKSGACSACPFAKKAAMNTGNTACSVKSSAAVAKKEPSALSHNAADSIADYESQLKQVETVNPDVSAGQAPVLAAQSEEAGASSGEQSPEKSCGSAEKSSEKSCGGDGSSKSNSSCPSGEKKSCDKSSKSCPYSKSK